MRRQTMRMGTTCVVVVLLTTAPQAQVRVEEPARPARGWALSASPPAEARLPELVVEEGPGVRIRAPRDLALFRPAFHLRGTFTLGATFQRQAASGPTAPYGLIAGGEQGLAFVLRPDGAYAVQPLTGGTLANAAWVARARAGDPAALERLEVRVEGETAAFLVNGTVVTTVPIAPGALDGAAGVYVGELGEVAVLGFSLRTSDLVLPSPAVR